MNAMIQIRNLEVARPSRIICRVAELTIYQGETVAIVGPNGCGKTTLLRVLAALEPRYAGQCRVAAGRADRVYVHQDPYLFHGSVLFNVAYGMAAHRTPRQARFRLARDWLARLGIDHLAHRGCNNLSGGEKRRVALARSLAIQPRLLLLDEPFADLDRNGIENVRGAIASLVQSTILIASPTDPASDLGLRSFRFD